MPNWCDNQVTLTFKSRVQFNIFLKQAHIDTEGFYTGTEEEKESFFDLLVPTPDELEDESWYNWRIKQWGTKWNPDIYELEVYEDSLEITIGMSTAWNPPSAFFRTLTNMFPSLTVELRYDEPGMGLYGKEVFNSIGRKNLKRKRRIFY
jgi:hypothetical protein